MTQRKIEYWVIPPQQDAEFVAHLEDVLEIYATASDPQQPVLCMDEQPMQLLLETRVPLPATKQHARRVDYEYERNARFQFLDKPILQFDGTPAGHSPRCSSGMVCLGSSHVARPRD